ncbi:MAG TPA: STAS domain-containing protein [Bacteroidia bacterium]|nr:STAS domain-containing protein [Bacteroidia bacterium]
MNQPFVVERSERYSLIRLQSEKLDTMVAPALKSELVVLNADGVKNLIIDLTEIRYCDSSGLSAILVANRLCKNANGTLVVTGLQEPVKKLIAISQLDSILKITPDITTAIDRLVAEDVESGRGE